MRRARLARSSRTSSPIASARDLTPRLPHLLTPAVGLLARAREKRLTTPLFDTRRWTKEWENSLLAAWAQHASGQPPCHLEAAPLTEEELRQVDELNAQDEAQRKAIVRAVASAFIVQRTQPISGQKARLARFRHEVMAWDDVLVRASPADSA